ncbi:MAG: S24 family peptidase [Bacteroidota bacterium]
MRKALFRGLVGEDGLSIPEAAEHLGVTEKTIRRYLDESSPSAPSVAALDFLSGHVPGSLQLQVATGEPSSPQYDPSGPKSDASLVAIPYIVNIEAAAHGPNGGFLVDLEHVELEPSNVNLPAEYIRSEYKVSPERVFYISGAGNSMVPTILPGQRVMIALLPETTPVRDSLIYIIEYLGSSPSSVIVKRLHIHPGKIEVAADNPEIDSYFIPLDVWQAEYRLRAVVLETAQRH